VDRRIKPWYHANSIMMQRPAGERTQLPLIVAVTGHRDLNPDETTVVTERVRKLFETFRERYPHTPILLLSSLAEGADRLVASVAMGCGAELYAVLPMPREEYEKDFATSQSLHEFRRLMDRRYGATVVAANEDDDESFVAGPARDRRYAMAGAFMVTHSQILIALWDGNQDEVLGGTSQIVRFALRGVPPRYVSGSKEPLRTNETGAVYHIRATRGSSPADSANEPGWLYPGADAPDATSIGSTRALFEESLRSLERFNRDAGASSVARQARTSAESLLPAKDASLLGERDVLQYTRMLFGTADALALRCRNWTHAAMTSIFVAIALAAILLSLYTNLFQRQGALYAAFLALVVVAFAIDLAVSRKGMQDRFQDYRALAEGFRVQFYWQLAGITESVYDHYLARQEGELDWIRNAMRASRFRRQAEPHSRQAGHLRVLLEVILARWINEQAAYFSRAVRNERSKSLRIKTGSTICLIASGVLAIVLAVSVLRGLPAYRDVLIMLLTLALAGAGLFTGYAQKRAHEEHARRYQRMRVLYKIAGERVSSFLHENDLVSTCAVLVQLGREALAETCDWLLLHRERQIDVPTT
jgi:hypothetical protein